MIGSSIVVSGGAVVVAADVLGIVLDQNIEHDNSTDNHLDHFVNKPNKHGYSPLQQRNGEQQQQQQTQQSSNLNSLAVIDSVSAQNNNDDERTPSPKTASETGAFEGISSSHSATIATAKVSRSSIATLLSVTLTMILLSLLQAKKRSLRKRGLVLRGTSVRRRHSRTNKHSQHQRQHSTSAKDRLSVYASSAQSSGSNTLLSNSEWMEGGHAPLSPSLRHLHLQQPPPHQQQQQQQHLHDLSISTPNPTSIHSSFHFPDEPVQIHHHHTHLHHRHDRLSKPPRALITLNLEKEESLRGVEGYTTPAQPSPQQNSKSGHMYGTGDVTWSLSEGHLPPGKRTTKKEFVAAWLEHQDAFPAGPVNQGETETVSRDQVDQHRLQHHYRPAAAQQSSHLLPTPLPSPQRLDFLVQAQQQPPHPQQQQPIVSIVNNSGAHRDHHQLRPNEPSSGTKGDYYNYHPNHPSPPAYHQQLHHQHPRYQQGSPTFHSSNVPLQPPQPGRRLPPSATAQPVRPGFYPRPQQQQQQQQQRPHEPNLPRVRNYIEPELIYHHHVDPDYRRSTSTTLSHRFSLPPLARSPSMAPRSTAASSTHYPAPPRLEDLTPAERVRQEHQMRRQWHQMQQQTQQQFRQQQQQQLQMYRDEYVLPHVHSSPSAVARSVTLRHHARHAPGAVSAGDLGYYPSSTSSSVSKGTRSAKDLAWERHCYYQQQQLQEEALAAAARKRQLHERQQQGQQQHHTSQSQVQIHALVVPESETAARTRSLNRLASSELTSQTALQLGLSTSSSSRGPALPPTPPTSVLGYERSDGRGLKQKTKKLERSNTNAGNKKDSPTTKPVTRAKSMTSDCKFLSMFLRKGDIKDTSTTISTTADRTQRKTSLAPVSPRSPEPASDMTLSQGQESTSLSPKKTMKDLAPSFRSLARRFGSSRPNSYAGSGSDRVNLHLTGGPSSTQDLSIPRELTQGPDGIVDLQQATAPIVVVVNPASLASISTPSLSLNHVTKETTSYSGTTRRVALFRSKTMTLSKSRQAEEVLQIPLEDESNKARRSGGRRHDSLRLANGRGLDLTMLTKDLKNKKGDEAATARQEFARSTSTLDGALPSSGLYITNNNHNNNLNIYQDSDRDADLQQEARRQVVALLAMGRKDRVPSKPTVATATTTTMTTKATAATLTRPTPVLPTKVSPKNRVITTTTFISPLALEALEPPPVPVEEKSVRNSKKEEDEEEDLCERIAFMLVPKSRYEFQPLVAAPVGEK
ncbi:hypothetical protein BGZ83_009402 [Gryganskiella cystojenkinii]|nr:hypothetical protein BGZ83_009402 [Gryganskiella cystojenkinii]